jgi:hypothetical protein
MLECESLRPLFEFLAVPKNNKKHWSDTFSWTMSKFMCQAVMKVIRVTIQASHYIVLHCDEVSIIHNQSWLSIHYYVVQIWVRILILLSLNKMVVGSSPMIT